MNEKKYGFEYYDSIMAKVKAGIYRNDDLINLCRFNPILFSKVMLKLPFTSYSPMQQEILENFYDPQQHFRELLLACGRKSGKSVLSTVIATFDAYRLLVSYENPQKHFGLLPNSPIYCLLIAPARDQAMDIGFEYARSLIASSPFLSQYISNETSEEIVLDKNIVIRTQSSSSRAGRGYQVISVVFDEIAWFIDRKGNLSGDAVYNAMMPNLKPLSPDSHSVLISSPAGKSGIFFELYTKGVAKHVHQKFPTHNSELWRLCYQATTPEMNPRYAFNCQQCDKHDTNECLTTCPSYELYKEWKRNPDSFQQEYLAAFADAIDSALPAAAIYRCATGEQINIEQYDKATNYIISLDPGLSGNRYALAMMHVSGNFVVCDLIKYWTPSDKEHPVPIADVEAYVEHLCKHFNISNVLIDQYQSASTAQRLQEKGIPVSVINVTMKYNMQAAEFTINRINSTTITYPKDRVLINEFLFLQRKVTGKNIRYEAAINSTDDIFDAVSRGVLYLDQESTKTIHIG